MGFGGAGVGFGGARVGFVRAGVASNGESTRLPPMWPGFESWRRRRMFVLSFAPRGFSPGTPVFLFLKNQIPIRSGTHGHVSKSSEQLLSAPCMGKQITVPNDYCLRNE